MPDLPSTPPDRPDDNSSRNNNDRNNSQSNNSRSNDAAGSADKHSWPSDDSSGGVQGSPGKPARDKSYNSADNKKSLKDKATDKATEATGAGRARRAAQELSQAKQEDGLKGVASKGAEKGAEHLTRKGLDSLAAGLGQAARAVKLDKAVGKLAGKTVALILGGLGILVGLLLFIWVGMEFGSPEEQPEAELRADATVSAQMREIYEEAAETHDVPVTILAAIGEVATEHGRYSPYDQCDRDPNRQPVTEEDTDVSWEPGRCDVGNRTVTTSVTPRAFPQIGDATEGQGLGPMLITPQAAIAAGYSPSDCNYTEDDASNEAFTNFDCEFDPNHYGEATNYIAAELAAIRDQMIDEGFNVGQDDLSSKLAQLITQQSTREELSEEDWEALALFWEEAVNRLPLADPQSGQVPDCIQADTIPLEDDRQVATYLQTISLCQLNTVDNLDLTTYVHRSGEPVLITGNNAAEQITEDLLETGWRHSGLDPEFCTTDDNGNATSGIIPLPDDATLAGPLEAPAGVDNSDGLQLCDPRESIHAALQQVVADATQPPNGGFNGLHQGVGVLPGVTGNEQTQALLTEQGPYTNLQPPEECVDLIDVTLEDLATQHTGVLAGFKDGVPTEPADVQTATIEQVTRSLDTIRTQDPGCMTIGANDGPAAQQAFMQAAAVRADQQAITFGHSDSQDNNTLEAADTPAAQELLSADVEPTEVYTGLAQLLYDQAAPVEYDPDTHTMLRRISPTDVKYPSMPSYADPTPARTLSIGREVVATARDLGGLAAGDPTTSNATLSGFGAFGVPLVIERDDHTQWAFHETDAMVPLNCGLEAGSHQVREHVKRLWENMCQAAERDGVTLGITSSYRSYEQQAYLYQKYLNGTGNLAAQPADKDADGYPYTSSGSNHQRGTAMDVYQVGDPNKGWLHEVVGCYSPASQTFERLDSPQSHLQYSRLTNAESCTLGEIPIKRMQTYGFMPLCFGEGVNLRLQAVMECQDGGREDWHIEPGKSLGIVVSAYQGAVSCNDPTAAPYIEPGTPAPTIIVEIFRCRLTQHGVPERQQRTIVAEALATSHCESAGFQTDISSPTSTATGLFQFIRSTGNTWIDGGWVNADDPAANTDAAARLVISNANTYGGNYQKAWVPWACVWPVASFEVDTSSSAAAINKPAEDTVLYQFEARNGRWVITGTKDISRFEQMRDQLWRDYGADTSIGASADDT